MATGEKQPEFSIEQRLFAAVAGGDFGNVRRLVAEGTPVTIVNQMKSNQTPLHEAVARGYVECALFLIEKGADVDARDTNQATPLHVASFFGQTQCCQLLITKKCNVLAKDARGFTCVHYAAFNGNKDALKALIQLKADVDARDKNGRTPLSCAALQGKLECMRVLLDAGAEVNSKDNEGRSPLYWATRSDRLDAAMMLIDEGALINARDRKGRTPLFWAVHCGHNDIANLLVDKGAGITWKDIDGKQTLHWAAAAGNTAAIPILITDKRAEVNVVDKEGSSALHAACAGGHIDTVRILIKQGANINVQDKEGRTPLDVACFRGHVDCAALLVEESANVNLQDKNGRTALFWAACSRSDELCRLLLEKGANVEAKDSKGRTPLFFASLYGSASCARILLDAGAFVNHKEREERTPIFWAVSSAWIEVARLLKERGAMMTLTDNEGRSILHWASSYKYLGPESEQSPSFAKSADLGSTGPLPMRAGSAGGTRSKPTKEQREQESTECIKLCVSECGISTEVTDINQRTPLFEACMLGCTHSVRALVDLGANLTARDLDGRTPTDIAALRKHEDCAKVIMEKQHQFAILERTQTELRKVLASMDEDEVRHNRSMAQELLRRSESLLSGSSTSSAPPPVPINPIPTHLAANVNAYAKTVPGGSPRGPSSARKLDFGDSKISSKGKGAKLDYDSPRRVLSFYGSKKGGGSALHQDSDSDEEDDAPRKVEDSQNSAAEKLQGDIVDEDGEKIFDRPLSAFMYELGLEKGSQPNIGDEKGKTLPEENADAPATQKLADNATLEVGGGGGGEGGHTTNPGAQDSLKATNEHQHHHKHHHKLSPEKEKNIPDPIKETKNGNKMPHHHQTDVGDGKDPTAPLEGKSKNKIGGGDAKDEAAKRKLPLPQEHIKPAFGMQDILKFDHSEDGQIFVKEERHVPESDKESLASKFLQKQSGTASPKVPAKAQAPVSELAKKFMQASAANKTSPPHPTGGAQHTTDPASVSATSPRVRSRPVDPSSRFQNTIPQPILPKSSPMIGPSPNPGDFSKLGPSTAPFNKGVISPRNKLASQSVKQQLSDTAVPFSKALPSPGRQDTILVQSPKSNKMALSPAPSPAKPARPPLRADISDDSDEEPEKLVMRKPPLAGGGARKPPSGGDATGGFVKRNPLSVFEEDSDEDDLPPSLRGKLGQAQLPRPGTSTAVLDLEDSDDDVDRFLADAKKSGGLRSIQTELGDSMMALNIGPKTSYLAQLWLSRIR